MTRAVLPGRRPQLTDTISAGGVAYEASVGFDPVTLQPRELFLAGAKDGTDMAAILADTSVVVSIALQYGVPARALARSVARRPLRPDDLAGSDLAGADGGDPASVIGAALDLVARYESESAAAAAPAGMPEAAE